jgi:hypothetical protein
MPGFVLSLSNKDWARRPFSLISAHAGRISATDLNLVTTRLGADQRLDEESVSIDCVEAVLQFAGR